MAYGWTLSYYIKYRKLITQLNVPIILHVTIVLIHVIECYVSFLLQFRAFNRKLLVAAKLASEVALIGLREIREGRQIDIKTLTTHTS